MKIKPIGDSWGDLKSKIRSKWGKFTDEEVERAKTDLSQLTGMIQRAYGIAKDQAEHQYEEFKKAAELQAPEYDTPKASGAV